MSHSDFQPLWRAYPPDSMRLGAPAPHGNLLHASFPDPMMHPINGQHVWTDHRLPAQSQLAAPPGFPPFPPMPPAPSFGVPLTDSIIVPGESRQIRAPARLRYMWLKKTGFVTTSLQIRRDAARGLYSRHARAGSGGQAGRPVTSLIAMCVVR